VNVNVTNVPFNDLGRAERGVRRDIDAAVARVMNSGWYVLGPENEALETELASYVGVPNCVTVGNGTDALQLALTALGVSQGDAVLTAANAGGYTSTAARAIGAVPVYADVDPSSFLVTVQTLDSALARLHDLPKAVVVTHLYGGSADMTAIMEWATRQRLPVIEDCAQSLGALHNGRPAGSFGHVSTTSFYPTKNLGALGDGGALFSPDTAVAGRIRKLRQYGWESKYRTDISGGRNSRMDELQAAIVRAKLPRLDAWNEWRRSIHRLYEERIGAGARLVNAAGPGFVGHLAVVEVSDRDRVVQIFERAGVRSDVHYPVPDHRQRLLDGSEQPRLPVTEAAADRVVSVPLFPELTDAEVERVGSVLSELS
jgi:dTDP-4-amino-4,6-dideoxygalactose transaminase